MYKVTLCMPVYNVEKYVERALLSALSQTFESIEYLLVDDKGTDNSMSIVKEIIKSHPRGKDVRIIEHGVNIGTGGVKNTGIDNAQGKYLYFMDSDDEITPDSIQVLYAKMMETQVDFVEASYNYITNGSTGGNPGIYPYIHTDETIAGTECAVACTHFIRKVRIIFTTWNKLYNIDFLRKNNIRCIPNHLNEDEWFVYQVILYAKSCVLLSCITYQYYKNDNSTMSKQEQLFTSRFAQQYMEICKNEAVLSENYSNCIFYSELAIEMHSYIMRYINSIYRSPVIPKADKKYYCSEIWKSSSTSLSSLKKIKNMMSLYYCLIDILPTILLKIYFRETCLFFSRFIKRVVNV